MKKTISILLTLLLVCGLASSALAVSWAQPSLSSSASPFTIEVIKLGVNTDVTGAKYYTVLTDAAVFSYSNIYYAIKLTVPSVSDLNSYYGTTTLKVGDQVKTVITYTNISGKTTDTVYVTLGGSAKTLWFNGTTFDESWTTSLATNCGCGNNHILSAVATDTAQASIKACIGATGSLSDIKIDGCYSVVKKNYYGVKPCSKCSYTDLSGFLFSGDCAAYDVFFSTGSTGKVTGIYAIDKYYPGDTTTYAGTMKSFSETLYGWQEYDVWASCGTTCAYNQAYALQPLYSTDWISAAGGWTWTSSRSGGASATSGAWELWQRFNSSQSSVYGGTVGAGDRDAVYYYKDGKYYKVDASCTRDWYTEAMNAYALNANGFFAESSNARTTGVAGTPASTFGTYYTYDSTTVLYGDWYYYLTQNADGTATDATLYKMTSATTVECDTNEASYLSAINHMLALLGFTYADVAAGNIYMTEDNLLTNFGFATGAICSTANWGAYTAAITVAAVAEIPATGSVSYIGFGMLALAIAAAVVTKRVRA